jgi:hypothetical protein
MSFKYFFLTACFLLYCLPASAGDLMNVEFLQVNAKKSNVEIQSINELLSQYLYNNPPSRKEFILNTISNGLFTATYFITDIGLMRGVGTAAGGLFYLPYPLNYFKAKKTNKEIKNHFQRLALLNEQLDIKVKKLYTQWKEGSPSAKDELVQLTNPSVVSEIETNIRLELVLLQRKGIVE